MVEKIIAIKEKSSFLYHLALFALLVPVTILIVISFFSPLVRKWLVDSAKKLLEYSIKKDESLKKQIEDLNGQIKDLDSKDEDLKKKLDEIKNSQDADWHKRK